MSTAFAQLVDNAVKYSEPDSPIGIAVALINQEVTVTIESQGRAHPARRLRARLRPLLSGRGSAQSPAGTGLGLSIVRRIVDAHRGRVWAESGAGGRSIFSIALPATPDNL
jgi:two-component system sensor histidine kinase KdpD